MIFVMTSLIAALLYTIVSLLPNAPELLIRQMKFTIAICNIGQGVIKLFLLTVAVVKLLSKR